MGKCKYNCNKFFNGAISLIILTIFLNLKFIFLSYMLSLFHISYNIGKNDTIHSLFLTCD